MKKKKKNSRNWIVLVTPLLEKQVVAAWRVDQTGCRETWLEATLWLITWSTSPAPAATYFPQILHGNSSTGSVWPTWIGVVLSRLSGVGDLPHTPPPWMRMWPLSAARELKLWNRQSSYWNPETTLFWYIIKNVLEIQFLDSWNSMPTGYTYIPL